MSELYFGWDLNKNTLNQKKHGVSFEEAKTVLEGDNSLKMAVSKVPIDDWTALLEKSWGAIEETHFFYA